MKKLLVGFVVLFQIVTLIQVSADFVSAAGFGVCENNWDDDRDGKTDMADPGCHTDYDANNASSYDPSRNTEHNAIDNTSGGFGGFAVCENNWDDDGDNKTDEADPGCHTDYDANNASSYDPSRNTEHNAIDNTSSGSSSSRAECNDDRDNDGDGKTDETDPDCRSSNGSYNPDDNNEFTSCLNGNCYPPTNHAPVCPAFTAQYPTYTVNVGSQFSLDIDATDPDGDSITYSLTEKPSGMSINSTTGLITWTPTSGQAGHTYDVTVRARDSEGASCNSFFTIRVRANDNPCYPNQCPPPPVYDCSDNQDNDGDNKIDYPEDPGCYGPTDDNEYNAPSGGSSGGNTNTNTNSNTNTSTSNNNNVNNNIITIGGGGYYGGGGSSTRPQCDDNRDNDGDGDYDYPEDRGCSSYSDNTERSENDDDDDVPQCRDGRDNDNDGDRDYPEDRGCSSRNDDSERSENDDDDVPQCRDGRDNDRDGDYDYPEDRGCSSRNDDSENSDDDDDDDVPQCRDGRDNDGDGDRDYPDDRGCSSRNDDSERSGSSNDDDDAPYFTSSPTGFVVAGQTYTYNADAISPDGRTITYSLGTRPSGMTINSYTGLVQWFVPSNLGNSYQSVSVRARDDRGNETTQSFTVTVSRLPIVTPVTPVVPVTPRPPVTAQLSITNLDIDDRGGDVIVTFETNREAEGSVRFGEVSELTKTSNFTYPISRPSAFGEDTFHEVNLGPLEPNQVYFLRAFATAGSRSAFSPELAYTRSAAFIPSTTEVAGTDSCFDGVDNDRDGVADAADSDCTEEEDDDGRVAGATFASTLESFGAFLISPWFLLLVIIVLVIYIIVNRRTHEHEYVATTGPIEIKS